MRLTSHSRPSWWTLSTKNSLVIVLTNKPPPINFYQTTQRNTQEGNHLSDSSPWEPEISVQSSLRVQSMFSALTWKTMWDRLSSSRSNGSSSCSFLPLRINTGLSLGNTRSRITSLKGSPTIGNSAGLVLWLTSATQKCATCTHTFI